MLILLSLLLTASVKLHLSASFLPAKSSVVALVTLDPFDVFSEVALTWDGPVSGSTILACPCPKHVEFNRHLTGLPAGHYDVIASGLANGKVILSEVRTIDVN